MTRTSRTLICAAAALCAAAATAPAALAGCKPTKLKLSRGDGRTTATLTWRTPHGVPAGARFRVYRGHAVVGQVRRPKAKVRVSFGRRYKLAVRVVRRNGRLTHCVARKTFKVSYRMPGLPGAFGAQEAAPTTVRVAWQPARRGDSPITGYRVLRDGAVYRQTNALSMDVPLVSQRTYRFQVLAVDRRGRTSAPTAPVTVTLGHHAPTAPADVTATDVTDSSVTLQWSAPAPTSAGIAAYRILRDGVPVKQVPVTTFQATSLYAQRAYTFQVQAVDTRGYVSDASAPLAVTTVAPPPSTGNVHAFLLASTSQSFKDFQAHYRQIAAVYPTYYDCDTSSGALIGKDDALVDNYTKARKVALMPRFNCQRTAVLHRILTDPALRSAWLDGMVGMVDQYGYDGLNLDFEAGAAADRQLYTDFVTELADRLHARGKRLALAVSAKTQDVPNHPRSTFFDYLALSEHADTLFVMAWGIHWATGPAGAQDDMPWVTKVADYVATMPNRSRFVMGTMLYGMDWARERNAGEEAITREYDGVADLIGQVGATPTLDATADGWTFSYTASDGRVRDVWYPDAQTIGDRIRLARERGLGVGFWRLGREDQRLWDDPQLAAG
jgi:spore germination protein YaaH